LVRDVAQRGIHRMPRPDLLLPADEHTGSINNEFIIRQELGYDLSSRQGVMLQMVGEMMTYRLMRLCKEGAAAHARNK
jgi:hypothetical protein